VKNRAEQPFDRRWSLRPSHEPPEPPRLPDTADAIDRIMRQPAAPPQTADHGKDKPVRSEATADIHGPADIANRIKNLAAHGVTQLGAADVKAMSPEQIVQAQRDGRLMQYMTGIDPFAADRAAYQRGRSDTNDAWTKALASDEDNDG
jgi:hypothetical protein